MEQFFDENNYMAHRTPKYIEIRNYLYELIKANVDNPSFKLPSENMLAQKFKVSRITSKQAFTQLEKEGLISRVQGKGTFINSTIKTFTPPSSKITSKNLIGLILPDLKSNFMIKIIDGVESYARKNDFMLLVSNSNYNQEFEYSSIKNFYSIGMSGIVIIPVDGQKYNKEILRLSLVNYPIVFVDRSLPGIDVSIVSSDHMYDAFIITEYLIRKGHTKIGFISTLGISTSTINERITGYQKAMNEANLTVEPRFVFSNLHHYDPNFEAKITEYVRTNDDLTAIITLDSDIGYRLLMVLRKLNIQVPQQISVASFDDELSQYDDLFRTQLTSTSQDAFKIGSLAAKLLIERINNPLAPPKIMKIKSSLNIKTST